MMKTGSSARSLPVFLCLCRSLPLAFYHQRTHLFIVVPLKCARVALTGTLALLLKWSGKNKQAWEWEAYLPKHQLLQQGKIKSQRDSIAAVISAQRVCADRFRIRAVRLLGCWSRVSLTSGSSGGLSPWKLVRFNKSCKYYSYWV